MFKLTINGQAHATDQDLNLLVFLRDHLRLTSVKDGCSEGACGACMVLVDGKAAQACLFTTAKLAGRRVVTVEGLSKREKEVYAAAFAGAGAVQCGFCIPGMVISAKGLLDANPDPTPMEVKRAIDGNLCRCTGYVKIEQAILEAAKLFRHNLPVLEAAGATCGIGGRLPRLDARDKVLGTGEYADDLYVPGMLHAAVLRAPRPRVKVLAIDPAEARRQPGVVLVLTAGDVPGERFQGPILRDWPVMVAVGEETRHGGDALALVAAGTKAQARTARDRIRLEYQELPPLATPRAALVEDAPRLHPRGNLLARTELSRGDADGAIAQAAHVSHHVFHTPPTDHAFLEPGSALALPEADGSLTVYTGSRSAHDDRHGIAAVLGVATEKVRVISKLAGGGFGGQEGLMVQQHAALLAWVSRRPVKLTLTRQESIRAHPRRHAMEMDFTVACDAQGLLTAMKASLLADTGAYASPGGPVLQRACTHAAGPYKIPNVAIQGLGVCTNNPPAGAFSGFGLTQSCFAMESCLNDLAAKLRVSPWQLRFQNAVEAGDVLPNGQIAAPDTALKQTLLAVRAIYESRPDAGIACCMYNSGLGPDRSEVGQAACSYATQVVFLDPEGRVERVIAAHDVGQVVNATSVEAQIEGGVVMGLGYALTEDHPLKDRVPTARFGNLGLFRSSQVPAIVSLLVRSRPSDPAFGAKGVGEIVTIPTAPAVAGAYFRRDRVFRTELPLSGTPYSHKK